MKPNLLDEGIKAAADEYTALQTGLAFLPMTAIILPADLASGWLATPTGARLPIFVGQVLMLVGCAGRLEVSEGTPYWRMTAQLLFIGSGIGLTGNDFCLAWHGGQITVGNRVVQY